jgi:hypothetical protein
MELLNFSPFATEHTVMMDGTGIERLLVVVKATFSLARGTPVVAEEPEPVVLGDEYYDKPETSSLRRAGEMPLEKPATEIVVVGSAYPAQRGAAEALVALQLGPIRKAVRVVGERVWAGEMSPAMSRPIPFEKMPLVWERAYGGRDESGKVPDQCPENPVGRGFRSKSSKLPIDKSLLPNLEDPLAPMRSPSDRPRPCGLGPIAPWWSPRPTYAGTYDEKWQKERLPLLPDDFSPIFHHAAPHDQIIPGPLTGGEVLTVSGVRPGGGGYHFALPSVRPEVSVRIGEERVTPPLRVDTIIVDCDAERLCLVLRASVSVQMRLHRVRWIKIQEAASA